MTAPSASEFSALWQDTLRRNDLPKYADDPALCEAHYRLTCRMLEVNEHMNLTTITDLRGILLRHYADSLHAARHLPQGAAVLDLGCGAGFPSLPLALARPDLSLTCLDSTEKKVRYVAETAALLGIPSDRLRAVCGRAEELCSVGMPARESFDVVISRAVARLPVLCELSLPFLRVGGSLIALKGAQAEEELEQAAAAISRLGGAPGSCLPAPLFPADGSPEERHALILIKKATPTPKNYPRKYAQILKKPL